MADARIYEAKWTLVKIQDPDRMSGKIYPNKYTNFVRKVFLRNLNKKFGCRIPGYPYLYFSLMGLTNANC
jgi:hypothetical protein